MSAKGVMSLGPPQVLAGSTSLFNLNSIQKSGSDDSGSSKAKKSVEANNVAPRRRKSSKIGSVPLKWFNNNDKEEVIKEKKSEKDLAKKEKNRKATNEEQGVKQKLTVRNNIAPNPVRAISRPKVIVQNKQTRKR